MAGNKNVYHDAMRKGHNLAWDGRDEQAVVEYRRAAGEFPEDTAANVSLGSAYLRLRRLPEALAAFEAVLRKSPEDVVALARKGETLALMGKPSEADGAYRLLAQALERGGMTDKALAEFRQAARLMPDLPAARARLGAALGKVGQPIEAGAEYLAAALAAGRGGQTDQAIEFAEQAVLHDAANESAARLLDSLTAGNAAVAAAGESWLQASGGQDSGTVRPGRSLPASLPETIVRPPVAKDDAQDRLDEVLARARQLQSHGQIAAALAAYEEAVAAGIRRAEVEYNLGVLLQQSGRHDEAIQHLALTSKLPDYAVGANLTIARGRTAQGRADDALESFMAACDAAEASELAGGQVDDAIAAYRGVAESYRLRGQTDEERQVLSTLADLLTAKGWRDRAFAIRAELGPQPHANGTGAAGAGEMAEWQVVGQKLAAFDTFLEDQHYLAAIEECHDVISLAPGYLPVHYKLGTVYSRQGRTEHAADKYMTLATLHMVRGETAQAIEACRLAASVTPRQTRPRSRLAELYLQTGEIEKALEELDVLGDLQLQAGDKVEAKATIRQIISLGPPDVDGYQQLLEQLEAHR